MSGASTDRLPRPGAEDRSYDQVLRTASYAWWRPVVGVLVVLVTFFLLASFVLAVVALLAALVHGGDFATGYDHYVDLDSAGPVTLLGLNLGLASFIPVTWLIVRIVHGVRPRWLASVVPGLRWGLLGVCFGLAAVALVTQLLVGQLLPDVGDDLSSSLNPLDGTLVTSALVVLVTTPLQAVGEEYLFRGYLLQAFGAFFGRRWVAIGVSALLFALAHGTQNAPLFLDRLAFGLLAAYLVVRTGGLEAGIALHVLNNFLSFGLALAFSDLGSTLTVSGISWWNIVLTVTQSGVYVVLVLWAVRRRGEQTVLAPSGAPPADPPGGRATTGLRTV